MSKQLHRFDFTTLRDFRAPLQARAPFIEDDAETLPPPPPPPPVFSEEQLQQARLDAKKAGYHEGFQAGQAQAEAEHEAATRAADEALQGMAAQLAQLATTYTDILRRQSLEVSELALLVARKVAEDALREHSLEVIAALVTRCLPVIYSRPRIQIELHPDTLPAAEPRLREQLLGQGYENEVLFRANPALAIADARIDWGSGFAERNTQALWHDIELLLARVPLELELPTPPVTHEEGA